MTEYRIYSLTSDFQITGRPAMIECEDDDEAVAVARETVNGHDIEMWEAGRFVTRIKSTDA